MTADDLIGSAYAMPLVRPGYAEGGTRFLQRETMKIRYRTSAEAVTRWVPEPLTCPEPIVTFEVASMHDASGCGVFHESGQKIEVELDGAAGELVHILLLDNMAAILAGREVFGFPKKLGHPQLVADGDALIGSLDVGRERVATASMGFKYEAMNLDAVADETTSRATFLIKTLPHVDGSLRVCELVSCHTVDVVMHGAWSGPGDLQYFAHAMAPLNALPIHEVIGATHTIMDMNYGPGVVEHDYLA